MEHNMRVLSPEELMGPLLRLLDETAAVPLVISGGSMVPFLIPKRDSVYLSKADRKLKRGDMVLYQRDNGHYVLHRVFRAEKGLYTMVGDAQTELERGIRPDQIFAVATAVRRKEKLMRKNSFWWFFFEKIWIRMVPLRPVIMKTYQRMKRLLSR